MRSTGCLSRPSLPPTGSIWAVYNTGLGPDRRAGQRIVQFLGELAEH